MKTKLNRDESGQDVVWREEGGNAPHLEVYSIGDLAREFGISLRALRFYESKGLIEPRRNGTTRLYSFADRQRVGLILQGKRLGFTLAEIRNLLAERMGAGLPNDLQLTAEQCLEQLKVLERQKFELDEAIAVLRQSYKALSGGSAATNGASERPIV
jgi:DNA-binding transcriptional MerR regulator